MIAKEKIAKLIQEALSGSDKFLVDFSVSGDGKIMVELDSPVGVNVIDCRTVSRHIESNLDREEEDFELTVSSPGLDKPFRVFQQYLKNVGRKVEVELNDGTNRSGKLLSADKDKIELESSAVEKVKNKKQEVVTQHTIQLKDIKQTKVIISFK